MLKMLSLIRNPILRLDCLSLYCTCLSSFEIFPNNPYLVFAACEQLLAGGYHDYAFNIFVIVILFFILHPINTD